MLRPRFWHRRGQMLAAYTGLVLVCTALAIGGSMILLQAMAHALQHRVP